MRIVTIWVKIFRIRWGYSAAAAGLMVLLYCCPSWGYGSRPDHEPIPILAPSPIDDSLPGYEFLSKKGEKWQVGIFGKEQFFNDLKGFQFIHFLLSHPNEEITPPVVYHLGAVDTDSLSKLDYEGLSWDVKKLEKIINQDGVKAVLKRVNILKKELKETDIYDPNKKIAINEEVAFLEKSIEEIELKKKFKDSVFENARTNVTKRIKETLEKLNTEMPDLETYLSNRTIKTGSKMIYKVPINNPPEWIL